MTWLDDEPPGPLGVVVERARGSLPFALLHGEPLVACAAWAMGEAGIRLLDLHTPWDDVRRSEAPLVLHDALCPMAPPDFLADCVRRAQDAGVVVVGVLPVTDTVKEIDDDGGGPVVGATLDRDRLVHLASPVVLPTRVVAALEDWPSPDFAVAVTGLRERFDVELAEGPIAGRRVASPEDVRVLEAVTRR